MLFEKIRASVRRYWLIISVGVVVGLGLAVALVFGGQWLMKAVNDEEQAPVTSTDGPQQSRDERAENQDQVDRVIQEVDRSKPESVALAFASIATSWDPKADSNETAAIMRAGDLINEKVRKLVTEASKVKPRIPAMWNDMYKQGAVAESKVLIRSDAPGHRPYDEHGIPSNQRIVDVVATWDWKLADGKVVYDPPIEGWFSVLLEENSGEWTVAGYEYNVIPVQS